MENNTTNPYKTPEATVENTPTGQLFNVFDRFTAWGVFGLSLITFNIYNIYWLYSRTQKINDAMSLKISPMLVNIASVCGVLSIASNFIQFMPPAIGGILTLASLAYFVMYLIWCYKIRAAIHEHVNAQKGTYAWANAFLTIFGPIYLQYKINKIIDNE